jgi:hypothetical protein
MGLFLLALAFTLCPMLAVKTAAATLTANMTILKRASFQATTPACAKNFGKKITQGNTELTMHMFDTTDAMSLQCAKECARFQKVTPKERLHLASTIAAARIPFVSRYSRKKDHCTAEKNRSLSLFIQMFIRRVVQARAAGNVGAMKKLWVNFCKQRIADTLQDVGTDVCKESLSVQKANVFMLGDSITRHMLEAVCRQAHKSNHDVEVREWSSKFYYKWGHGLPYGAAGQWGDTLCNYSPKKMANLHLFGSAPSAPYGYSEAYDRSQDQYVDTHTRVRQGMRIYVEKEGVPTMVVLDVLLWDIVSISDHWSSMYCTNHRCTGTRAVEARAVEALENQISKNHTLRRDLSETYQRHMRRIIHSVQLKFNRSVPVVILTVPQGLHSLCTLSALSLHSLSALSLHSLCTLSALSLHTLCTLSALSLHSLCTLSALSLHFLCTLSALSLHSLCTLSALSLHTLCTLSVHSLLPPAFSHTLHPLIFYVHILPYTPPPYILRPHSPIHSTPCILQRQKDMACCIRSTTKPSVNSQGCTARATAAIHPPVLGVRKPAHELAVLVSMGT